MNIQTMDGLAAIAKQLDALADQVRASQKAVTEMQRQLFSNAVSVPGVKGRQQEKVADSMMVVSEVMSAFGIRASARSTLARRMNLGLIPKPMHPNGQQAAVWRKSQIEELLEMTMAGACADDIRAQVAAFNRANGNGV